MNQIYALGALMLFAPAFSIGVVASLFVAPGTLGNTIFTVMKVWVVAFPLLWTLKISPQALRLPKYEPQEVRAGLGLGIIMFAVIISAYFGVGQQAIDLESIRSKAVEVGIVNPYLYLAGCVYWSLINSLIEECTWRGFAVSQCKVLVSPTNAVIIAALLFTVHHSIALYAYTHDWLIVSLGSLGVFLAGTIWAGCYSHYQSVVPGYISHILADVAIALIGYQLLFL
ncbi:MAG: CPBP family intramembrane glutamic endopeptidase [Cyanobacteria bacterium P01_A01_bin.40]